MKHNAKMQHRLHPMLGFLAANRVRIAWVHLEGGDSCCKTISPCIYHVRHLELSKQHRRELKDGGGGGAVFERVLALSAHASDTKRSNTLSFSALVEPKGPSPQLPICTACTLGAFLFIAPKSLLESLKPPPTPLVPSKAGKETLKIEGDLHV